MHTFVHPTKTGGTALEQYFQANHRDRVSGAGHLHTCASSDNPIVIVREPMDRFKSMFSYWRNGAADGQYTRDPDWIGVNSIGDFIRLLRSSDYSFVPLLLKGFTTQLHFAPQTHWLAPSDHARTIVLTYDKDGLEERLRGLLAYLGLPASGLPLPRVNVSKRVAGVSTALSEEDEAWMRGRFQGDFALWHLATKHPNRFKKVF
jgi:hypothetical protein